MKKSFQSRSVQSPIDPEIIAYLKKSVRTASEPIANDATFKVMIAHDEVIISCHSSFPLKEEDKAEVFSSLRKILGSAVPAFSILSAEYCNHQIEYRFKKDWVKLPAVAPENKQDFEENRANLYLKTISPQSGVLLEQFAVGAMMEQPDGGELLEALFHVFQGKSAGFNPSKLEMKKEQPTFDPTKPKELDHQLFHTIASGNFDQSTIQDLLDKGASPIQKYAFKGDTFSALSLSLVKWSVQSFMPGTPVDKTCALLNRNVKKLPEPKEPVQVSWNASYEALFGEEPPSQESQDKVSAIKKIMTDVTQLFHDPERCMPLFEIIEREIRIEWAKTHSGTIPLLDEATYDIQCHDRTLYPVPKEGYDVNCFPKKNSVLQRTIYRMLRDFGIVTGSSQKWIQGIPKAISRKYLQQLVLFVEDTANPTGLLHGKISHGIQWLLICLAIEKGLIDTKVGGFNITAKDLLSSLMNRKFAHKKTKILPWMPLLDTRCFPYMSLTDPHRLHSLLLTSNKREQFRLLSDCMIHSFCNSLVEISKILNHFHDRSKNSWIPRMVWDRILTCMSTEYFFDFNLNLEFEKTKRFASVIERGTGLTPWIILEKNYADNAPAPENQPNPVCKRNLTAKEDCDVSSNARTSQCPTKNMLTEEKSSLKPVIPVVADTTASADDMPSVTLHTSNALLTNPVQQSIAMKEHTSLPEITRAHLPLKRVTVSDKSAALFGQTAFSKMQASIQAPLLLTFDPSTLDSTAPK